MARLRNLIKQGGVLGTTSTEEVSKLAAKQGRTAAPLTPLETSVLGGNPDQAKMAATPNQRINAIRQQFAPAQDLATTQRRGPELAAGSPDVKKQQLAAIEGLANLGERVRGIALRRFQQQEQAGEELSFDTTDLELTPEQQAALDRIRRGESNDEDYRLVADSLLGKDANAKLAITDLVSAVNSRLGSDAGASVSAQAAGRIRLSELTQDDLTELGFDSFDQMAGEFNIDSDSLQQLTLSQMQDLIDSKQAAQFDRAAELRAELRDPNVTAAQRQAALAELTQMGMSGEQDIEREYEDLERQVREGRSIKFGGESVDVEQLLDNDYIKTKSKMLLEDADYRDKLAETDSAFVDFVEAHAQAFKDLTKDINTQAESFVKLQEDNLALAKPNEGMTTGFSDSVMSAWYEDWGDIKSDKYEDNGIIQLMRGMSKDDAAAMETTINSFAQAGDEDILKEIGQLSVDELKQIGFTRPDSVSEYQAKRIQAKELAKLDVNVARDKKAILGYLGAGSLKELETRLVDALALNSSGFGKIKHESLSFLDSNKDGKLDGTLSDIVAKLQGRVPTSLRDLINQGKTVDDIKAPILDKFDIPKPSSAVYDKVKKYFTDGKVSSKEANDILNKLDVNELDELYKMKSPAIPQYARGNIERKLKNAAYSRSNSHFAALLGTQGRPAIPEGMVIRDARDLFTERDRLMRRNKELGGGYQSPFTYSFGVDVPGGAEYEENIKKLNMLNEVAKFLISNTPPKGYSGDTSFATARILYDVGNLRKFKNW